MIKRYRWARLTTLTLTHSQRESEGDLGPLSLIYSSDSDSEVISSSSSSSSSSEVSFFLRDFTGAALGRPLPRAAPPLPPLLGATGGGVATFLEPFGRPRPRFREPAAPCSAGDPFSAAAAAVEDLLCLAGGGVELAPEPGEAARALFWKRGGGGRGQVETRAVNAYCRIII